MLACPEGARADFALVGRFFFTPDLLIMVVWRDRSVNLPISNWS
jgi:hypothetical protein